MKFPESKTKIVCTLGPSSHNKEVIKELALAGMNVARLNLSHDTKAYHRETLQCIREVEKEVGFSIPVMMDIPGPKIRIGKIKNGPILLKKNQLIRLTTRQVVGNEDIISVDYPDLFKSIKKNNIIYLYDGFIQLYVQDIIDDEAICKVVTGGKIDSHKGLNLPGTKLFVEPIQKKDLDLISFGLEEGVSIFGISFVEKAEDINKVKAFARRKGHDIFTVAKIERQEAVDHIQEILEVTDAVMVARGDLGVQVAIEDIPVIQKKLITQANLMNKPVITATQMLVSMTDHVRPTRSEVTDVANAILDGTDATMLSEETAMGQYPIEATRMMTNIAVSTERQYRDFYHHSTLSDYLRHSFRQKKPTVEDVISMNAIESSQILRAKYILTPTESGNTTRRISRFKPNCWILSFTVEPKTAQFLAFSYGVVCYLMSGKNQQNHKQIMNILKQQNLIQPGDQLILTEGIARREKGGTDSFRIISVH